MCKMHVWGTFVVFYIHESLWMVFANIRRFTVQETADDVAGLQSGNKIWEDWLRTS